MPGAIYRNIVATFLTRFLIAGSGLIIAILLSRFLGATGRGEQSLLITLITFIIIVNSMVGASAISFLIPRYPFQALIFPSYIWVLLVSALGIVFLPPFHMVPAVYLPHVCLLSFILGVYTVNVSVLISKERIAAANLLAIVQSATIILFLLFSFLIRNEKDINSYIESLYAGYVVSMMLSLFMIRRYFRAQHRSPIALIFEAIKKMFVLGFYNQMAVLTQMLSFRISYYILNQHYGPGSVGLYANAITVAESVWLIGRSMAMVQYSKIVNSPDQQFSIQLTYRILRDCFIVSSVLLFMMAFIPDALYGCIFGKEFTALQSLIRILAPGVLFFAVVLIISNYFSGTGRHYINAIASSAGLAVTLLLGFVFIPLYGLHAAAATASISYGVTALITLIFLIKDRKIIG